LSELWRVFGLTDNVVVVGPPVADFTLPATNGVTVSISVNPSTA
jgi:hypothetical protein